MASRSSGPGAGLLDGDAAGGAYGASALQDAAAEVQDYVVGLRGGAAFLSGADSQLLGDWLRAGLPVALILAAVDDVADKRRRKRSRKRLTLSDCRKAVEKRWSGSGAVRLPDTAGAAPDGATAALSALAEEVAGQVLSAEALAPQAELVATLMGLAAEGGGPAELGQRAVAAVSRFHAAVWEASAHRHGALRERAEAELAALRGAVPPTAWAELVEEVARDLLRQEHPSVSARRVWDSLGR